MAWRFLLIKGFCIISYVIKYTLPREQGYDESKKEVLETFDEPEEEVLETFAARAGIEDTPVKSAPRYTFW